MCGIYGFYNIEALASSVIAEKIEEAWIAMSNRGIDSFGFIAETVNGRIFYDKDLWESPVLKGLANLPTLRWIVAHNRKASVGKISKELAHPIISANCAVIQNGTKKSLLEVIPAKSDTQAIHQAVEFGVPNEWLECILEDCGVVLIWDFIKDFFIFHKSNRPLFLSASGDVFASQPLEEGVWFEIKNIGIQKIKGSNPFDLLSRLKGTPERVEENVCVHCKQHFLGRPGRVVCDDCRTGTFFNVGRKSWWIR